MDPHFPQNFPFLSSHQRNQQNPHAFPQALNLNRSSKQDLPLKKNSLVDISDSFFDIRDRGQMIDQISSPPCLSPLEVSGSKQQDYDDLIKDFLISGIDDNSKTIFKKSISSEDSQANNSPQIKKRQTWRPEEDAMVFQFIENHGQRWNEISKMMGNRSGKQIRDRYLNVLMPHINKSSWTKQEDKVIISKYQEYGSEWRHIAQELQGRTEAQVKNRFHTHLKVFLTKKPFARKTASMTELKLSSHYSLGGGSQNMLTEPNSGQRIMRVESETYQQSPVSHYNALETSFSFLGSGDSSHCLESAETGKAINSLNMMFSFK